MGLRVWEKREPFRNLDVWNKLPPCANFPHVLYDYLWQGSFSQGIWKQHPFGLMASFQTFMGMETYTKILMEDESETLKISIKNNSNILSKAESAFFQRRFATHQRLPILYRMPKIHNPPAIHFSFKSSNKKQEWLSWKHYKRINDGAGVCTLHIYVGKTLSLFFHGRVLQ